eukprot:15279229-Alexandrium_andersonii.AAC.1
MQKHLRAPPYIDHARQPWAASKSFLAAFMPSSMLSNRLSLSFSGASSVFTVLRWEWGGKGTD